MRPSQCESMNIRLKRGKNTYMNMCKLVNEALSV